MCEEKPFRIDFDFNHSGSPPRVRGKETVPLVLYISSGITPACAGKRYERSQNAFLARDHPRVCGEKFFGAFDFPLVKGSPPRVRGKGI